MLEDAIFSDGTEKYCSPWEPKIFDKVQLKIRTARSDDLHLVLVTRNGDVGMRLDDEDDIFDYYKCVMYLEDTPFEYCYRIEEGSTVKYYDRLGLSDEMKWQNAFEVVPGFHTPNWFKGAVSYQIYVDRFYNGNANNDVLTDEYAYAGTHSNEISDWNSYPDNYDVCNFYGGDLEGVRKKFDYLKGLGVEVIYLNPIFVSPSNHKYDIQDYEHVDPHLTIIKEDSGELLDPGDDDNRDATRFQKRVTDPVNLEASNEFFAEFIKEAHERGFHVIMDGVFNHCGSFNKWMDRERIYEGKKSYKPGAYIDINSPYHDYFQFDKGSEWPYNGDYFGWWGHETLPKLNFEGSDKLTNSILDIGSKWVSEPFNADGWRLDVAADLGHSEKYNHEFWKKFRKAVKRANPDAIILAEHYGDAKPWLGGDQWDTIMNYDAFMEPVTFFLTGMEKHSDMYDKNVIGDGKKFEETMKETMAEFLTPSLYCSMNQLSNHDHSRFLTRTNHVTGRVDEKGGRAAEEGVSIPVMKEATLMLLTWPGAPTLYYGDEAGVCGFTDPDNRRTYPWGRENRELIDFHRDMINVHKRLKPLKNGSFMFLKCERDLVSYGRFDDEGAVIVVVNSGDITLNIEIPVWKAGVPMECELKQKMITNEKGYSIFPLDVPVKNGMLKLNITPFEAAIYSVEFKKN